MPVDTHGTPILICLAHLRDRGYVLLIIAEDLPDLVLSDCMYDKSYIE